ncbi:MAG: 4Fe-4S dicluster domain-containing protein [Planctomycetes bacterium]|nr:4Fe-4S dicluster domain-containing protein [Planctomycetota bacterium]
MSESHAGGGDRGENKNARRGLLRGAAGAVRFFLRRVAPARSGAALSGETRAPTPAPVSRREFFRGGFARLRVRVAEAAAGAIESRVAPARWMRPPGAGTELEFLTACERCHECAPACEYGAIRYLGPEAGLGVGTPALFVNEVACRLCRDLPCQRACPSGALRPLQWHAVRMGHARISEMYCWAYQGKACTACARACPLPENPVVFTQGVPVIRAEGCTGCGLCFFACPATPNAITVRAGPP